jgi:hypothetical protein
MRLALLLQGIIASGDQRRALIEIGRMAVARSMLERCVQSTAQMPAILEKLARHFEPYRSLILGPPAPSAGVGV